MHRLEPSVGGKVVPISSHRQDEGNHGGTRAEDLSRQSAGFIDRVIHLVQKTLQKHEIPEAFDRSSDARADS